MCLFCSNVNWVVLCVYVGQEELVLVTKFVIHSESLLLVSLMWKYGGNTCPGKWLHKSDFTCEMIT